MGNLSRDFNREEFECKCRCGFDTIDPRLIAALQELRDLSGVPIKITSGCRCKSHNANVGGTKESQHVLGYAADIVIQGKSVKQMAELAEKIFQFQYGAILQYPKRGFIHVDVRGKKVRAIMG